MRVLQIPQLVKHCPLQCCYPYHVSSISRFPLAFVSLHPSAKPIIDTNTNTNNQLIQSLYSGGNLKKALEKNSLSDGIDVNSRLVGSGLDQDPSLDTKLINMYCDLGSVDDACKVFDGIREKTIFVWNAIFWALAMVGRGEDLLDLYGQMNWCGTQLNRFTYTYMLKACVVLELSICPLWKGKAIHAHILRHGYEGC